MIDGWWIVKNDHWTYVGFSLKAFEDVVGASELIVEQVERLLVHILVAIADKQCPVIHSKTKTR